MSGVFGAGRILNPKTARSQVIGAMTMGVGAALMEEAVIDKARRLLREPRHGRVTRCRCTRTFTHLEVVFLDEVDPKSSPMKAKGVGELGICGAAAAVANAVYNACGVRIRNTRWTLDKVMSGLSSA